MYKILRAEKLAENIYLMDVEAPRVAKHCEPGQFVIVKMDEKGERIPLTICDYDREAGTITTYSSQSVHLLINLQNYRLVILSWISQVLLAVHQNLLKKI